MDRSVIIYFSIFCFIVFSSMRAEKSNKKITIFPIIGVLTFLAGFRNYSVGMDTWQYVEKFNVISLGKIEYAYGLEYTFRYICKFLLHIYDSPTFLLFVFSLLTNSLIILRFWDLKKVSNFTMMIICYYCTFYFYTFNVMRQMCSVAIIFFATRYLKNGNYVKYLLSVAIAYCFHNSSIIGLILYFFEFFRWSDLKKQSKKFLIFILLITPWCVKQFFSQIEKYSLYLDKTEYKIGFMLIVKTFIYLFFIITIIMPKRKTNNLLADKYSNNYIIYYGIGIVLTAAGYVFLHMERIGLYFYLFEGYFWGIVIKNVKNKEKTFYFIVLGLILMYYLYGCLFVGGQGQLPYYFVWENR